VQDAGFAALPISVNVSAVQFRRGDLVAEVKRVLDETGLESRYLELELTESLLMDKEVVGEALTGMRALGVKITIDDFGTGYSSLSYLKRYPIDKLKIDRSFIDDLGTDADDRAIAVAIINLAKTLKLTALAEGWSGRSSSISCARRAATNSRAIWPVPRSRRRSSARSHVAE